MNAFLILIACVLVYLLVALVFRAAYLCSQTNSNGCFIRYATEQDANFLAGIWPISLVVYLCILGPVRFFVKLSNGLYNLCFRMKNGKAPLHKYY